MQKFGGPIGKTIFHKGAEAHKLHEAFTVATGSTIHVGEPVKLNADGEAVAAADAEPYANVIGYSIHYGEAGEEITIAMKGYATVYCKTKAAVNAGPVDYDARHTDAAYSAVATSAGVSTQMGWALDKATAANALIRVVIF